MTKTPLALTPRETEIVTLLWEGLTNAKMAHKMGISPNTVEAHRASINKKLGTRHTAQVLRASVVNGIVPWATVKGR